MTYIGHASTEDLNRCHVAVVERFPGRKFRIVTVTGTILKFDAPTTLKWLHRNPQTRRWVQIL